MKSTPVFLWTIGQTFGNLFYIIFLKSTEKSIPYASTLLYANKNTISLT